MSNFSHMWKAFNSSSDWPEGQTHEWTASIEGGEVLHLEKPRAWRKVLSSKLSLRGVNFSAFQKSILQRTAFLFPFSLHYTKNFWEYLIIGIGGSLWQRPSFVKPLHSFQYSEALKCWSNNYQSHTQVLFNTKWFNEPYCILKTHK